ncbi:hypothetical protein HET73_00590 [Wolbachia endosymbiont of Atemnus politus]|nr:hypothetical protein [Wolbachia endosymbiont of Atemnus politus]
MVVKSSAKIYKLLCIRQIEEIMITGYNSMIFLIFLIKNSTNVSGQEK